MIGSYIRGLRHLVRILDFNTPQLVLMGNGSRQVMGAIMKVKTRWNLEQIIYFQRMTSDRTFSLDDYYNDTKELIRDLHREWGSSYVISGRGSLNQFGEEIILLPIDVKAQLSECIKRNRKTVGQAIENKLGIDNPVVYAFFNLCADQPNLFAWAINNYAKDPILFAPIKHVLMWQNSYGQLIGKLSKGTITAYNGVGNINALMKEIVDLRQKKRANDVMNMFNTAQKKILKSAELGSDNIKALGRVLTLSDTKQKNLIRKVSTIDDLNEILRQISFATCGQFEWSKDSVLDFINNVENLDCRIVLNAENLLLVEVANFETIKHLAKTTNWCISKNKSYWNNYMGNQTSKQYVLFNFNCKEDEECSIVGFTTDSHGSITNAHSFTNINMMNGEGGTPLELTSFLGDLPNIYTLLKRLNIPMSSFLEKELRKYEWNMDSFMNCLTYCINEENYSILKMDDDLVVVATKDPNVRYLIGKTAHDRILRDINDENCTYILFCDFENEDGPITTIIHANRTTFVEKCTGVFDSMGLTLESTDFDGLLNTYGLPYDIICRSQDKMGVFKSDFNNFRLSKVATALDDEEVRNTLLRKDDVELMYAISETLTESVISHYSLDLIKLIYSKGLQISSILAPKEFSHFMYKVLYNYVRIGIGVRRRDLPSKDTIAAFHNNSLRNDQRTLVGWFVVLDMLLDNEKDLTCYTCEFTDFLRNNHLPKLCEHISLKLLEDWDMTKFDDATFAIFKNACDVGYHSVIEMVSKKGNIHPHYVTAAVTSLPSSHPLIGSFRSQRDVLATVMA